MARLFSAGIGHECLKEGEHAGDGLDHLVAAGFVKLERAAVRVADLPDGRRGEALRPSKSRFSPLLSMN